jgi:hypothetical protein
MPSLKSGVIVAAQNRFALCPTSNSNTRVTTDGTASAVTRFSRNIRDIVKANSDSYPTTLSVFRDSFTSGSDRPTVRR